MNWIIYNLDDSYNYGLEPVHTHDDFYNSTNKKILVITPPPDILCGFIDSNLTDYFNNIQPLIQSSNYVFFNITEIHPDSEILLSMIDNLNLNNITIFLTTFHIKTKFKNIKILYNSTWINSTTHPFHHLPNLRDLCFNLNSYDVKPKLFDILLGRGGHSKPHRDFTFEMINQTDLNDRVIMNYFNKDNREEIVDR